MTDTVPWYNDAAAARDALRSAPDADPFIKRALLLQASFPPFQAALSKAAERAIRRAKAPKAQQWKRYEDIFELEHFWHIELSVENGCIRIRAKRPAEALPDYDCADRYAPALSSKISPSAKYASPCFLNPYADEKELIAHFRAEKAAARARHETYLQSLPNEIRTLVFEIDECFPDYKRLSIEPIHADVIDMFFAGVSYPKIAAFLKKWYPTGAQSYVEKLLEKLFIFVDPFCQGTEFVEETLRKRKRSKPKKRTGESS